MRSRRPIIALALILPFCHQLQAQSPTRSQTFLVSESEVNSRASVLFQEIKSKAISRGLLLEAGAQYDRVRTIAHRIIDSAREYRPDSASWAWEVILVDEDIKNAFCLPGGKVTLYRGLIESLELTDDELAAVIGHEVAHALREHGREKRSNANVANVAVGILSIAAGIAGYRHKVDPVHAMNVARLAGGATATLFFLLPNSREMELEADGIGVELAARAGFDPAAAQSLWRKMSAGSRLEFLSTHPSPETRVTELVAAVSSVSARFSERRATRIAEMGAADPLSTGPTPAREPKSSGMAAILTCELPDGRVETLALLGCRRLGGIAKEVEK